MIQINIWLGVLLFSVVWYLIMKPVSNFIERKFLKDEMQN